jgi:hypothetical protein
VQRLEQFDFETLPPALYGETSFACGAGGVSQAKATLFAWRSYHLKRSFKWYMVQV